MAILFALGCLGCAACNDLLFKFFARKSRSRGGFVAVVGLSWGLLTLGMTLADGTGGLAFDNRATWVWGGVSGFFSVVSNLLLIEAMARQSAGLCSTIFRMNLVPAVLGAFLLLGEEIGGLQWLAIFLALGAMAAFWPTGAEIRADEHDAKSARIGFALAAAAALLRAGMGLSYKVGMDRDADAGGLILVNALCWLAGGLLYHALRERDAWWRDRKIWRYGALSGLFCLGITYTMAEGLRLGAASVVLPVAQMSFLATFALSAWLLGEKVTPRRLVAVACGVGCIVLMALG